MELLSLPAGKAGMKGREHLSVLIFLLLFWSSKKVKKRLWFL
jgi:hypothetical protein